MLIVWQSTIEAKDSQEGLFSIVRKKTQRFLTSTHRGNDPTPIDWIFNTRSYGLKIAFTTALAGHLSWQGNTIIYREIRVTMDGLVNMMHLIVTQLQSILKELTLISYDNATIPSIDWNGIYDDVSLDKLGYCFLEDPQNQWVGGYKDWIIQRILRNEVLKNQWLLLSNSQNDWQLRTARVDSYLRLVDRFRGLLFVAIHLLSGQPSRTTELLTVRYYNTEYGKHRNIFIQNKMVMVVSSYHKGYRIGGQLKVIQRYLPRELGQQLVLYLWLVLPFCQVLQAIVNNQSDGNSQRSPFL